MEMVPSEENQFVPKEVRLLQTQPKTENGPMCVSCHICRTFQLIIVKVLQPFVGLRSWLLIYRLALRC